MRLNLFHAPLLALALMASLFAYETPLLEAATKTSGGAYVETVSEDALIEAYARAAAGGDTVRVLIVPGHEPQFGGAEFRGFYEREFVVDIADRLAHELGTDAHLEVFVARGNQGWNEDFTRYFDRSESRIERFVEDHKKAFDRLERRGRVQENEQQAAHNAARSDVALRLYGINRWANENDIDLVLHLHLNDETSHAPDEPGIHSGTALYVPDRIYGNADASRAIAEPVFARLNATNATSTFGFETAGILEDRTLIAIGAYNTAEAPSLLIEYGYIYEPRITGGGARNEVFADFAYQTALGVKDFLGAKDVARFSSKILPYAFTSDILATSTATTTAPDARGVYALQAALRHLGFYPGNEASLVECPVSGLVNECTTLAVRAFQASRGLAETGTLGPATRNALAAAFGLLTETPRPAAPDQCAAFESVLAPGKTDADTGGEVTRLQRLLAQDASLYPEGSVTGYFGPATLAAVKRFQVAQGVVAIDGPGYGTVGPATKAALKAACGA